MPHAIWRLRPSVIAGVPGSVEPIASKSPADMCARYHTDGSLVARCGSLARSGLPDADNVPSTTQLFEPIASARALPSRRSATAGDPCANPDAKASDQRFPGSDLLRSRASVGGKVGTTPLECGPS